MTITPLLAALTLTFVTVLAIVDFRSHRIPNLLTVSAALIGLLINVAMTGPAGATHSGAGLVVGFAIFMPLFLTGKFGAGDVKGMAAVGAFVGPYGVTVAAIWTLIAGLLGALAILLITGGYAAVASMFGRWMFRASVLCTTGQRAHLEAPAGDPARRRFPYGFAIACGTAASVLLGVVR